MQGFYSTGGPSWYLAKSLQTLAAEVTLRFPAITCLGTIGNQAHQEENDSSDHNPFIKAPNGMGVVRAIDLAGPAEDLVELQAIFMALYVARDSRVFQFGYWHRNNVVSNWPPLPIGGTHTDDGDVGHLHISVTQRNGNAPSSTGYLAAIDSTAPWGIYIPPKPAPTPPPLPEDDMSNPAVLYSVNPAGAPAGTPIGTYVHYPYSRSYLHVASPTDVEALKSGGAIQATPAISYQQHLNFLAQAVIPAATPAPQPVQS